MKKFRFNLQAVQRYKEQTLDLVKMEYAQATDAVEEQKKLVASMKEEFRLKNHLLKQKNTGGTTAQEMLFSKQYLLQLQEQIDSAIIQQSKLESNAESVKERMIEAKVESASLDLLKEKQLAEYNAALKKSEDAFIEEFISAKMYHTS